MTFGGLVRNKLIAVLISAVFLSQSAFAIEDSPAKKSKFSFFKREKTKLNSKKVSRRESSQLHYLLLFPENILLPRLV